MLWRVRLGQRLAHGLVYGLAGAGLIASARFAIDPPRPITDVVRSRPGGRQDFAAAGLACLFARAYLSWRPADPQARRRALESLAGAAMGFEAGMQPPVGVEQRVLWAQVVQERQPQPGEHVYTVAAETDASGLVYLSVGVIRRPGGALALAGYPAFVGAPASVGADMAPMEGPEVTDAGLWTVVRRALRNYLVPAPSELAADLAPGAHVSPPALGLALESVQSIVWAPGGGAVIAVVEAAGEGDARYTLAYEIDVLRREGRWEVMAIQMNPDG